MRTVIPFDIADPKTRLAPMLTPGERCLFAWTMLSDVIYQLREAGIEPEVLATKPVDCDLPVTVDDQSLDTAVNDMLASTNGPVAVVMADLALVTSMALEQLFSFDAEVVLAPGRSGGTNALIARHPDFRVNYHGASILDHRRNACELTNNVVEVDSFRLATDVDEPADLAEVLLHTSGDAATWLRQRGFELAATDSRLRVERDSEKGTHGSETT